MKRGGTEIPTRNNWKLYSHSKKKKKKICYTITETPVQSYAQRGNGIN